MLPDKKALTKLFDTFVVGLASSDTQNGQV